MGYQSTATQFDPLTLSKALLSGLAYMASRHKWHPAPHLDLLTRKLVDLEQRRIKRLFVEMPPRHGKSNLCSQYFPAWYLGRNPDHNVILASYESTFAQMWGERARDCLAEFGRDVFGVGVHTKRNAAADWRIAGHLGRMPCTGVTGGITGRGANMLIIDDPIKDAMEASSETYRNRAWDWYTSTARTRLEPDAVVICIQCMTGDTPVTLANGVRKRLDAIRAGNLVLAWKDGAQVSGRVTNWCSQGEDDVLELRTGNHRVRANAGHPFLMADGTWKPLSAIRKGDQVVCSGVEHQAGRYLTRDQAWLLGFMFGDGWVTRNAKRNRGRVTPTTSFVTCAAVKKNAAKNRRVLAHFRRCFGVQPKQTKFGQYRTEVARVGRWFLAHGLTGGAKGKRLPTWLFGERLATREHFLAGFTAADGSINRRKRRQIGLSNRPLVEDIRHLVRSCGMQPSNVSVWEGFCQPPHSPNPVWSQNVNMQWQPTKTASPFRTATVRSVEPCGRAEVFDLQVADAECFLADGLVSHNTRWHQEDGSVAYLRRSNAVLSPASVSYRRVCV